MLKRKTLTAAAALCAAALTLTACGSDDTSGSGDKTDPAANVQSEQKKGGALLDKPFAKPDLTLTDTKGKEYDLIEETKGSPTLLFFGYTHCPDVCPLTMSNIAIAKSKLSKAEQEKLRVVFVTSDPERDTPKRLGKWLRMQDTSFIGLTGDFDTIQAGARSVGVHIEPSYEKKNGDVVSTHGAQVLAFSPKSDEGYVLYTERTSTAKILEKELPAIVKGETP
ncbi:SCO family protein [Streptomyces sp. N2-109]|uniref:SCO family protein n=1 Tax=Streptomyces gossypii TaxID=2883101 RepID=A0ABT2JN83_9ACTN|nr:SCO family protein [Streptomyces gossypii]MCT2589335.1 SCO family protein [Streptomyces gossypii]